MLTETPEPGPGACWARAEKLVQHHCLVNAVNFVNSHYLPALAPTPPESLLCTVSEDQDAAILNEFCDTPQPVHRKTGWFYKNSVSTKRIYILYDNSQASGLIGFFSRFLMDGKRRNFIALHGYLHLVLASTYSLTVGAGLSPRVDLAGDVFSVRCTLSVELHQGREPGRNHCASVDVT